MSKSAGKIAIFGVLTFLSFTTLANGDRSLQQQSDRDTIQEARQMAEYGNKIIAEAQTGQRNEELTEDQHEAIQDARELAEQTQQRINNNS